MTTDSQIRAGLRGLFAYSPELIAEELGIDKARDLVTLARNVINFADHQRGICRHCFPAIFPDDMSFMHSAKMINGRVISSSCKREIHSHSWCANRNWTECSCSCECHCFVKNWKKNNND